MTPFPMQQALVPRTIPPKDPNDGFSKLGGYTYRHYESTNTAFEVLRRDSVEIETLKVFVECLNKEASTKFAEGNVSDAEMRNFLTGFSLCLSFPRYLESLRSFISSPEFRIRGNAYCLKYINDHSDVSDGKRIKEEILCAIKNSVTLY